MMKPSEKLLHVTISKLVPLTCVFELTRRCNLKCRHCYIDAPGSPKKELSTEKIKDILCQLAKAGSLNLVFTGGEIFLRSDIMELCRYARSKGFDLRLFTNGTFIDDKKARSISKLGIGGVEISLYGKLNTHEKVTGVKGSFSKALEAIRALKKHGVHVTIKCPVMKTNFRDYRWLAAFAKENGLSFKFDPIIAPRDSGDREILKYRLSGPQMSKLFGDPLLGVEYKPPSGTADFSCSAGVNLVTIGYDGKVYPCLQLLVPVGNLLKQEFSEIWRGKNPALSLFRELSIDDLPKCGKCGLALICRRCPGIALLEDGTLTGPSKIACKIAGIEKPFFADFE